jgi:drug/metabolite transporter (DMT)-like permease
MSTTKKQRRVAIGQMFVCAALWSIAGILIKLIDWHPLVIAGFRGLFAAITVGVYMLVFRQKLLLTKNVILSAFFLSATFICFVSANKLTTAANAIVLQFTAPIFIMVFSSLFFRQKFHLSDYVTVALTFIGIAVFFVGSLRNGGLAGDIIAVLSGMFMAGMYIFVGRTDASEKMSGMFFGQVITALVGIPFMFYSETVFTAEAVAAVIILGVVQIGIPYILLALASRHCPPLACSIIGAVEPLLNPVWVLIFDGERPGLFSILGGIIVIAAVTAQCVFQDRRTPSAASRISGDNRVDEDGDPYAL